MKACLLPFGRWSISVKISRISACSTTVCQEQSALPKSSQLNYNYGVCRHEPTTKPTGSFLCFHTTAAVIALPTWEIKINKYRNEDPKKNKKGWCVFEPGGIGLNRLRNKATQKGNLSFHFTTRGRGFEWQSHQNKPSSCTSTVTQV